MAHGKKYRASVEKVDHLQTYSLEKAVDLVKEMAYAKFDETVEVSMKLNIKSKHTIRDVLALPHLFGKDKQILVFAKGDKAEEARKAGAAFVGDNDLIEKIKGGWLDFFNRPSRLVPENGGRPSFPYRFGYGNDHGFMVLLCERRKTSVSGQAAFHGGMEGR